MGPTPYSVCVFQFTGQEAKLSESPLNRPVCERGGVGVRVCVCVWGAHRAGFWFLHNLRNDQSGSASHRVQTCFPPIYCLVINGTMRVGIFSRSFPFFLLLDFLSCEENFPYCHVFKFN